MEDEMKKKGFRERIIDWSRTPIEKRPSVSEDSVVADDMKLAVTKDEKGRLSPVISLSAYSVILKRRIGMSFPLCSRKSVVSLSEALVRIGEETFGKE